jgi:hypothetical protein
LQLEGPVSPRVAITLTLPVRFNERLNEKISGEKDSFCDLVKRDFMHGAIVLAG